MEVSVVMLCDSFLCIDAGACEMRPRPRVGYGSEGTHAKNDEKSTR